jgi:transcriptional regulator with XRE-family HTH domain
VTISVQVDRNRLDTNRIGFDRRTDALPVAVVEAPHADSDRRAVRQSDEFRSTFRKQDQRARESIDPDTVAARLNRLFDTIRPPGRGPLRNYEVLKALRVRGIEMSAPYLSQLRAGRRSHPSLDMLRPLADFFGVSVAYFTEATSAYTRYLEAELCWLEMANDPEVRRITTALLTLPPDVREDILRSAESTT